MRYLKQSTRKTPRLSLILLDWSVRESFHLLHYLSSQSVGRDQFEVIFIEYYSRIAEPLTQFAHQVDTWVLLDVPDSCIYHKHLMYNCGLALARGEIVVLCDSDAMVKDSFIETILGHFEKSNQIVLHLDQFRNRRKDLYPFNYPTFEEVLGAGCVNNSEGKTSGIMDTVDPLHSRNYGACMCARRADLTEIGGADEHIDYLGHICGPYEMTFRLLNRGFKEVWEEREYLYHTWHPGQAGVDNYQGPHDGRQLSSTALQALITARVFPLTENKAIRLIRQRQPMSEASLQKYLIDETSLAAWNRATIMAQPGVGSNKSFSDIHRGFAIIKGEGHFCARPVLTMQSSEAVDVIHRPTLESRSIENLVQKIDEQYPNFLRLNELINRFCSRVCLLVWAMIAPLIGIIKLAILRPPQRDPAIARMFIAPPVSGVPWLSAVRRYWAKYQVGWLAIKHYRAYINQSNNHLIANLYLTEPSMRFAVVLTTSVFMQIYLRVLSAVGILPCVKIKRLRKAEKIEGYLRQLSSGDYPQTLIVARDLYTNYYGLIKACRFSKEVVVL